MSNELDLTKYEGHEKCSWKVSTGTFDIDGVKTIDATARLIADAPLLLAEVKQLRTKLVNMRNCINCKNYIIDVCTEDSTCSVCESKKCSCSGCSNNYENWQPKGGE